MMCRREGMSLEAKHCRKPKRVFVWWKLRFMMLLWISMVCMYVLVNIM